MLSPHLFWDINIDKLDINKSKRLIIERVITLGGAKEIKLIIRYYGVDVVSEILRNLNYIDPKTLNFISRLFDIPLKSFKCFTRKQLNHQHWNS